MQKIHFTFLICLFLVGVLVFLNVFFGSMIGGYTPLKFLITDFPCRGAFMIPFAIFFSSIFLKFYPGIRNNEEIIKSIRYVGMLIFFIYLFLFLTNSITPDNESKLHGMKSEAQLEITMFGLFFAAFISSLIAEIMFRLGIYKD